MNEFASGLQQLNENWHFEIGTCAEEIELAKYGIIHNKCVDDDLMIKLFSRDKALMDFLGIKITPSDMFNPNGSIKKKRNNKDNGQRQFCGCIVSKDIGEYNTCPHLCEYCYANANKNIALKNWRSHKQNPNNEMIKRERIMTEYYFNFPSITSLTLPQQAALNEPNPIALSGGPGTGKSFVSLWRHISNHQRKSPIKSQLLTFTTSLAYYLKANSATQNEAAAINVDSTLNWCKHAENRDEIIVDEAQDMPLNFYEDDKPLRRYSARISYGADDKQILQQGAMNTDGSFNFNVCTPERELQRVFRNRRFVLDRNFRNTKSILSFAKTVFSEAPIPQDEINSCREVGEKPLLHITNGNLQKQNQTIIDIVRQLNTDEYNIGILTPLANHSRSEMNAVYYYNLIKDSFDCSFYDHTLHEKTGGLSSMKNIHITPFKSAKGLEFDTVIIPCFDAYLQTFRVISWRDFFVGITRAKSNLFLFASSDITINNPLLNSVLDKQIL
jgi:superfamily I DNA/RNA helicase